jgi:hypothetical protein
VVHVRKSHVLVWLIAAGLLGFLLLVSAPELWLGIAFAAAGAHFILNLVFSLRTRSRTSGRLDRPVVLDHQESSPAALERRFGLSEFSLVSFGASVRVSPPGIVRGPHHREELIRWKELSAHPRLRDIVDNAMRLQKFSRAKYTGVRVAEAIVASGDNVLVWGAAAKAGSGVAVKGSAVEGDPGALLVSSLSRQARSRGGIAAIVRIAANAVLSAAALLLAAVFAAGAPWWKMEQSVPWMNLERVGSLHWNGNGKSYELACRTLNLSGDSSWSLDASGAPGQAQPARHG